MAEISTQLIIGLDYELFFGMKAGTVEKCMIEPTTKLCRVLDQYGAKLTLFVDSGCLLAMARSNDAGKNHKVVANQLKHLYREGHDVQLHIHPHWEDSEFGADAVNLNTDRYRLHDFKAADISCIVKRYKACLEDIIEDDVSAYRAGGWCIQPFDRLRDALAEHDIVIDSTVYSGGVSTDAGREYDFSNAPLLDHWRFESDPVIMDDNGQFQEIAISSVSTTPRFYASMIKQKLMPNENSKRIGDGEYLSHDGGYYLQKLLKPTLSPASIDGLKAKLLNSALAQNKRAGRSLLNIMGHPKMLSNQSIGMVANFLSENEFDYHTIRSYASGIA